jgi:hypothetical protein
LYLRVWFKKGLLWVIIEHPVYKKEIPPMADETNSTVNESETPDTERPSFWSEFYNVFVDMVSQGFEFAPFHPLTFIDLGQNDDKPTFDDSEQEETPRFGM